MKKKLWAALFILFMAISASAATWYSEYDAALKAIAAKNWNDAESKLHAAMHLQPRQGRQVLAYGIRFIKYIPEYYLGVVYFQQGKYEQSTTTLQNVQKTGLVGKGDPEYAQMMSVLQQSAEKLQPKKEEPKATLPAPAPIVSQPPPETKTEPSPVTSTKPDNSAAITTAIANINTAIRAKDFPQAKQLLQQATALEPNDSRFAALRVSIERGQKTQDLEDRGLLAFLSGDYDRAIVSFDRVIQIENRMAEAWFYLGCSHAAQGLLQGAKGEPLLTKAKAEFANVRKLGLNFKQPVNLISPRILQIYQSVE